MRQALEGADPDAKPQRRLAEYSPVVEALLTIQDRLGELLRVAVASGGVKPPNVPPAVRPTTAIDRIRAEQRKTRHLYLVEQLLPHRRGDAG